MIIDLNPFMRPGRARRAGGHMLVRQAKDYRMQARDALGNSRDELPTVEDLIRAASYISRLLDDATGGEARVSIALREKDHKNRVVTTEHHSTLHVLGSFR